jgi:hypothetical protein
MAWPGREIDYQAEFGVKDKDELKAKLAKVAELETVNTTLKTTVEAQAGEVNTVKASLAAIEEKFTALSTANGNNNTNNNNNTHNENVEIPSVNDDENAAFATRMAPLWERTIRNQASMNKMEAYSKLASDPYFPKLKKELEELLKNEPLQAIGSDKGVLFIENAYHVVKGRHTDEIVQANRAGKGEFFIESASNSGNSGDGRSNNTEDKNTLTDDEKAMAARMHVSEEVFLKTKQANVNMSGALRYA